MDEANNCEQSLRDLSVYLSVVGWTTDSCEWLGVPYRDGHPEPQHDELVNCRFQYQRWRQFRYVHAGQDHESGECVRQPGVGFFLEYDIHSGHDATFSGLETDGFDGLPQKLPEFDRTSGWHSTGDRRRDRSKWRQH